MCKFQNFHSPVKNKKKKKKNRNFLKRIFPGKNVLSVFSFKKRTKYGKNVLLGSSVDPIIIYLSQSVSPLLYLLLLPSPSPPSSSSLLYDWLLGVLVLNTDQFSQS